MRSRSPIPTVLALLALAVLVLAGGGCGVPEADQAADPGNASTTSTTAAADEARTDAALSPGKGLADAKRRVGDAVGVAIDALVISPVEPVSEGADTVIRWETGKAEVDSATGRVYLVAVDAPYVDPRSTSMGEVELWHEASRVPGRLGWEESMLASLRFRQEQAGVFLDDSYLFCLKWSQYDREDTLTEGFVEVYLDSRTQDLVSFSVSMADEAPDVSGLLGVGEAVDIAETYIYLKTNEPQIPLAPDGSLILLGKTMSEELTVFEDRKITRGEPVLTWVISLSGTIGGTTVGGTVYVDATTGEVLSYRTLADG